MVDGREGDIPAGFSDVLAAIFQSPHGRDVTRASSPMNEHLAPALRTLVRPHLAYLAPKTMELMSGVVKKSAGSASRPLIPAADAPQAVDEASERVFAELAKSHWNRLHRLIIKNIGHCDDAEDLTQQAFTEAFRSYRNFRGDSELSTWLYGIAMNLVRNHLSRASHRRFGFSDEDELNDIPSEQADPEESAAQAQNLRALVAAMEELPCHMREIVLLMAMDDVSYEDAAALLDLPVGTVRSRLSRARSTLKTKLGNRGVVLEFS